MTLEEFSSLNVLKENEKIDEENVQIILKELTEKLIKSTEHLNQVKRRNLPKIKEIQREKKEIYEEIGRLKREWTELNSIKPITVLERRRGDFKTEGEYISKILNRNIKEEFINQMKRELKQMAADETETFDQISCTTIPGCDDLNEKLDERGGEGVLISKKTEKFLTILNVCHNEIINKLEGEKKSFEIFCYDMMCLYFTKRTKANGNGTNSNSGGNNANSTTNNNTTTDNTITTTDHSSLPQFAAVLLNDLNISIIFSSIHFKKSKKLEKICKNYFENFLKEQKEEISSLISSSSCMLNCVKRVALFLSRLEKVLKPLMIKIYFKNLKIILLNFCQEKIWKNLIEISEISEEEIENFIEICKQTIELEGKGNYKFSYLLTFKPKLECFQKLLKLSLIQIINSYHRREFKEISELELAGIVESVFAPSPLRNEFIKELELGNCDDDNEEYF